MTKSAKKGFIPEAPMTPPPLTIVEYKPCDDPITWAAAHAGPIELLCFHRSANRDRSKVLMRFFDKKLTELGFSEDAVSRLSIGLAEAIPNAMVYSVPESRVGVVLVITGTAPTRQLMLMVSNFITPSAKLPNPGQIPALEDILFETHGRGTGMLKILSNGLAVARSENYDLLTVVHFTEQLP